jgi:hypothetical protein
VTGGHRLRQSRTGLPAWIWAVTGAGGITGQKASAVPRPVTSVIQALHIGLLCLPVLPASCEDIEVFPGGLMPGVDCKDTLEMTDGLSHMSAPCQCHAQCKVEFSVIRCL